MKIFPKALQKATRDSIVGCIVGVVSFCLTILLIYFFLYLTGYNFNVENYITKMTAVATVITAVGTTANAYRERKQKKKEQIQKVITENRYKWLEQTRQVMSDLCGAEKICINSLADKSDKRQKIIKDIDIYVSQLILYLPYEDNVLCDEICCLANDVKAVNENTDESISLKLFCRIRAQENRFREILKRVWEDIKVEAKEGLQDD